MVSIPYALSVSHFINTVGADAGFAAIIGLALLVLLFFAQMRETSHLRDQVADATDHVSHLEHQIAQLSRGGRTPAGSAPGVAPRPASLPATGAQAAAAAAGPAGTRAVAPARARAVAAAPIAPAGVGAPALASATRLIPTFDDGPISVRQTGAAAGTGRAAAGAGAGAVASAPGAAGHDAAVMDPPGPPPATRAGGANGSATGRATPPPAGAGGGGAPRAAQAGRAPAPGHGRRAPAAAPRRTDYGSRPRSRLRGLLVALIALGVVSAIVVVLLLLTGGSSSPSPGSNSTAKVSNAPTSPRRTHHAAAIKPSSVNVVVLNGTSTPNLAHDVTQKLQGDGYKLGTPATATDQTRTATVVAYLSGHRAAAQIVAKSLGLGAGVVAAADQSSRAVACPQGAACAVKVIVTVGADLASVAASSTAPAAGQGTSTGPAAATGTGAAAATSTG